MSRLSYHIPNFTYGSGSTSPFPTVVAQAKEAEASGFDRITVMDHFYQLPMLGRPEEPMFEAYTVLGALAAHTSKVRLATMVTGNTYRNPTLLAKAVTALDHASNGRATLGIGAGWFELEHQSLGYEFGTFTDRFQKLEEALQIIVPMLRNEKVSFTGRHYSVTDAVNSPAPVSRIPILIGGGGEKKTLRFVAKYADESNLVGLTQASDVVRKLSILDEHCVNEGRNRAEISVSLNVSCVIAPTTAEAEADVKTMASVKGWNDQIVDGMRGRLVFGDPDTVGAALADLVGAGLDGLSLSLPVNGHIPGRVALLAETASRTFG
ncbi:MAG: LLM class F420-dependent oxidoreductase [Ilumatobacteraceae bacterium]|jgi:F420-dependent oxidoreductase-like protein